MEQFIKEVNNEIVSVQELRSEVASHSEVAIRLLKREIQLERIKLKSIENWHDFLQLTYNT